MKNRRWLMWVIVLAVAGFIAWKLHGSHFDWVGFAASFRQANWKLLLLAVAITYGCYVLRAVRWSIFLRPMAQGENTRWTKLLGSQFIGFAGLAIFGRIGELIRPYLVSRRTGLTFSSQIAVVTVERVFDLGAFGTLFALDLLLSPSLQTLPYSGTGSDCYDGCDWRFCTCHTACRWRCRRRDEALYWASVEACR
jgi:glycosyltransferase 2 family protein